MGWELNFSPLLPPPPPKSHPSLCLSPLPPTLVVFLAKPQHLPKGMAGSSESGQQFQAFADRPEESCSAAEGEGSKSRSRQPVE